MSFREKEMQELIYNVMNGALKDNGQRLVILIGDAGIGKSILARHACHYMCERRFFTGGVVQVQLKNMREVLPSIKLIQRFMLDELDLEIPEKRKLQRDICSVQLVLQFIINFFNDNLPYKLKNQKHHEKNQKKNNFLLFLDDVEGLVADESDMFQMLL